MDSLSVSQFKSTCLAVIERVRRTGQTVVITKRGEPVAELVPPRTAARRSRGFLGRMRRQFEIVGDVVAPVLSEKDWSGALLVAGPAKRRRKQ